MTQQPGQFKVTKRIRGAEIMLQDLPVGARLVLRNGSQVEIVENPRDGQCILVKAVGSDQDPELVFASEVAELPEQ
jgi:hypothetical protein